MFISGHGDFGHDLLEHLGLQPTTGLFDNSQTSKLKLKLDVEGSLAGSGFEVSSIPNTNGSNEEEDASFKPPYSLHLVGLSLIEYLRKTEQDISSFLNSESSLNTLIKYIKDRGTLINGKVAKEKENYLLQKSMEPDSTPDQASEQWYSNGGRDDPDWSEVFGSSDWADFDNQS